MVAWGIPAVITVLSASIFSRILGPTEYGTYALILSATVVTGAASFQWIRFSALRFVSEKPEDSGVDISTIRVAFIGVTLVLSVVALLFLILTSVQFWLVFLTLIVAVLQASFELGLSMARARERVRTFGVASVARAVLFLGFGYVASVSITSGASLLGALAIAYFIANLFLAAEWKSSDKWATGHLAKYWAFGWPASLGAGLLLAITFTERFLINNISGTISVGLYATSAELTSQMVLAIYIVVGLTSYPTLVAANARGGAVAVRSYWRRLAVLIIAAGSLIGSIIISFCSEIATIIVGPEYRTTFMSLLWLLVMSSTLNGIRAHLLDPLLHLNNGTTTIMGISATILITHVLGIQVLVPRYELLGAATSSVLAFTVGIIITWWFARRTHYIAIDFWPIALFIVAAIISIVVNTQWTHDVLWHYPTLLYRLVVKIGRAHV